MQPRDLIATAKLLANSGKGKPSQVNLRRAVSSAYYALFHKLARTGADLLIGGENAQKSKHAWRQTYRALEHVFARECCRNQKMMAKFPKPIEDFANNFVALQQKRHSADYDPHARFTKSSVMADIAIVEQAINDFDTSDIKDKRAFCAFVLFKSR